MQTEQELYRMFMDRGYTVAEAATYSEFLQQLTGCSVHSLACQFKDSEGWHAARATGIGGSDIAAIMGESTWKSPYDIWLTKTGQMPYDGTGQQSEAARWGNVLENSIAYEWAQRNDKKIVKIPISLQSDEHPFMHANIDGFVLDSTGTKIESILEIKTTSLYNKDAWEVGPIPYYYVCQATWYAMITGLACFDIVCLVGGQHLYSYHLPKDPDLCKRMTKAAIEFWTVNVQQLKEPAVTATDIERLQTQEVEKSEPAQPFIDESDATSNLVTSYIELRDKISALIKIKETIYAQIWSAMQKHDNMVTQSNFVSIKHTTRRSCDMTLLQRDYPEAYDACVSQSTSSSLSIK